MIMTDTNETPALLIDGKAYEIASLSDRAKELARVAAIGEQKINELSTELTLLNAGRAQVMLALKEEVESKEDKAPQEVVISD